MGKVIEINGHEYKARTMGFNEVADLSDLGIDIFNDNPMVVARGYLAICMGASLEEAGKEIEAEIIKTGDVVEIISKISEILAKEMEASDFFQALIKKAQEQEKETPQEETKKKVTRK